MFYWLDAFFFRQQLNQGIAWFVRNAPPPSNSKQVEQYLLIAVLVLQYYLCIDFLLACVVAKVQHTLLKLTFHQNYENIFRGIFLSPKKTQVLGNMKWYILVDSANRSWYSDKLELTMSKQWLSEFPHYANNFWQMYLTI